MVILSTTITPVSRIPLYLVTKDDRYENQKKGQGEMWKLTRQVDFEDG